MNKETFMKELSKRIQHLKQDERMSVLQYYNELIEDKIDSGASEKDAIDSLGTVDYIIFNINDVLKSAEAEEGKTAAAANSESTSNKKEEARATRVASKETRKVSWVKVLIIILLCPVIFGLMCGLIGAVVGIATGFIGVCIGVLALPIAGIYAMVTSLYHMTISLYTGLLQFALGLMLLSLGLSLFSVFKKLVVVICVFTKKVLKSVFKWMKDVFAKDGGKIIYE